MLDFILGLSCVFVLMSLSFYGVSHISDEYVVYKLSDIDMIVGYMPFPWIKYHFKWSKTHNVWVSKKNKALCPTGARKAIGCFHEEEAHKQKINEAKKEAWDE